jgi:hypothetical protein
VVIVPLPNLRRAFTQKGFKVDVDNRVLAMTTRALALQALAHTSQHTTHKCEEHSRIIAVLPSPVSYCDFPVAPDISVGSECGFCPNDFRGFAD